jgi:hypothetical protein
VRYNPCVLRKGIVIAACALCACHSNSAPEVVIPPNCSLPDPQPTVGDAGVLELGTHTVGDRIDFDVPPGTDSVTILEQARTAQLEIMAQSAGKDMVIANSAVPRKLFFPDGGIAYDDITSGASANDQTNQYVGYSFFSPIVGALTFPNTAASLGAGVPSGKWSFIVSDYSFECTEFACSDGGSEADTYDVKVILRSAGAALDVNFYIVGVENNSSGAAFTAASAAADPGVQRMVSTYEMLLANAGITVHAPGFYDVSASQQATYGTITVTSSSPPAPCDSIDQMFTISSAHPGTAVNIFLVSSIDDHTSTGSFSVVGIDGTIPGPAGLAGTVHSGAVVSMADLFSGNCSGPMNLSCGPDEVAYIAAHETGHYLGLFHTTEQNGTAFDSLSDTGQCPCSQCASATDRANCQSASLAVKQCLGTPAACAGGANLMFWNLDRSLSLGQITAQQARVMRLNPAVQ